MKLMILILKKFDINSVINKNAYILFYEKVDIDNEDIMAKIIKEIM